FEAARPAFDRAMHFVRREQQKATKNNRLSLGKALDRDAVAWMVLAGSYVHFKSDLAPVPRARMVAEAAQRSLQRDGRLARAHYYRCWGLWQEQVIPHDQGGPASPNRGRLVDALRELQK